MKSMLRIICAFLFISMMSDGISGTLFAYQVIPLPPPPAGIIPWGNPLIYAAGMIGYGLYRIIRDDRRKP